jgi:hypothetical protein
MDELAKIAAEEATKTGNNLLARIFGPKADALGINMGQGMRLKAVENQIRGLKKLAELCDREKFSIKQVNIKTVFPYLEGIALEEEPVLEDMWANLMANYLDSNKNLTQSVYPTILKQLSTLDIKILEFFAKNSHIVVISEHSESSHQHGQFNLSEIGNLERLGLVQKDLGTMRDEITLTMNRIVHTDDLRAPAKKWNYEVTQFGLDFYEACQR